MILEILTAAALAAGGARTDTTVSVKRGVRLEVENFGGSIAVSTWNRNAVRIQAEHSERVLVRLEWCDACLVVKSGSRRGVPGVVDYRITAPRWMDLKLTGVQTDVRVEDTEGEVTAETVGGDVALRGGRGKVRLQSVQGGVTVENARGRVSAASVNEAVRLLRVTGPIEVQSVNGDIHLEDVESEEVEGASVNGTVRFLGPITGTGRYRLVTHSGDVIMLLPGRPDASFSVETFNGQFRSSFPVKIESRARPSRHFDFILGSGRADVELESFQGTIRLARPGEVQVVTGRAPKAPKPPKVKREYRYRYVPAPPPAPAPEPGEK